MGYYPSGKPGNTIDHYVQNMREDRFQEYSPNYTSTENRKTKLFPLQDISVPIAIYAGKYDRTAVLRDSRWTRDQITHTLVHY